MPRLEIDNRMVEVPKGTKVIDAAEKLGIYIPRFCYHEALGSLGACRMCAVMFLEGPVRGLQMSCMIDAQDGMVVSTDHPEAKGFRSWVIEWMMLNHPHDCPVCDEGGHCLLQDMTVSGGHGVRHFDGPKRTYHNQDLGPLVAHEMNRCIHCWRCRRYYQEYAGYRDLGAMQIGWRTYFGRQKSGRLQSPFSGNLIDICPTGVYTDKPSRYQGRRWDFLRSGSICPHCSLGCATTVNVRYRRVIRLEARQSPQVNGHFICDRGRYGYGFANHPKRPRQARVDGQKAAISLALETAAKRLNQISQEYGPEAIAVLGSARMSLEAQAALDGVCRAGGWSGPRFFLEPDLAARVHAAVRGLDQDLALSQTELFQADFVLAVGLDPLAEAPMLALAMRQAVRAGAGAALLDPRPVELPFEHSHLPLDRARLEAGLTWLVRQAYGAKTRIKLDQGYPGLLAAAREPGLDKKQLRELKKMARGLARSKRPAIICGTDMVPQGLPARAAGLARLLREQKKEARLLYTLPGANAFGAVLAAPEEPAVPGLLQAMENGEVRALVLAENDVLFGFPDQARLENALDRLNLLVVLDHLPSATAAMAQVMIPTSNLFEAQGASLVNHEGRLQKARAAHAVGMPVTQVSGGGHPPREFSLSTPGGEPRPADQLLGELAGLIAPDQGEIPLQPFEAWLCARSGGNREPGDIAAAYGERFWPVAADETAAKGRAARANEAVPGPDQLELMVSPWFGSGEELSFHSPIPAEPERQPCLWLHPQTAAALSLAEEDGVRISLKAGELSLALCTSEKMSPHLALLIPGAETGWRMLPARRSLIKASALRPGKEA